MPNWTKQQEKAINENGKNIIVSAGAGSGKTAVLTARVLKKINDGININELLILTFTNAAAKEMKERIRKELKEHGLKKQLELIDGAFITTFDSFALTLVKKYHYLLNISANIGITDSTIINLKKEEILDEIFNELYKQRHPLFIKLINDFCIKDDDNIRKYLLNIDEKLNLRIDKQEYLKRITEKYYNASFIDKMLNNYLELIKEKIEELNMLLDDIKIYADGDYSAKIEESLNPLLNSNDYKEIKESLNLKLPVLPRNSSEELKGLKENLGDLIKSIKEMCPYDDFNTFKDNILLTCDYVTIISEIIIKLDKKINDYKLKNELFEFNDIVKMSISVIQNNEDVKESVKHSFKEIMVDEYQDTSDLQEIFINLIEQNNVYMVGDIKQSIYRFRNANPSIFKEKYDNYDKEKGGVKIDLKENFRSRNEVIKNINLFFNNIMDASIGGADYIDSHQMIFGNDNYEKNKPLQKYNMQVKLYEYDAKGKYSKEEIEMFTICHDIKEKIDNAYLIYDKDIKDYRICKYSDFAVLIDRSTSFSLAKKIFAYFHLPLCIYVDENINEADDLKVIVNLIKLLLKEKKRVYDTEYKYLFMSIARSFLFCYDDNKIFKIISSNSIKNDIIITKIKKVLENIENDTVVQTYYKLLKEFNFYSAITKLSNSFDIMVRLEYLNEIFNSLQKIGYSLEKCEEYLSSIASKGYDISIPSVKDENNSVKIMTIHKSKGLEFPICYFTLLDKSFNLSDIKDKFIYNQKYGIITPYFKNGIGKTIYIDLLKNDFLKEEISEKIRLFYVALTRAKEKMIFILPKNDIKMNKEFNPNIRKTYRSFADIIYSLTPFLDAYMENIDVQKLDLSKDYNILKKEELNLNKNTDSLIFKEYKDNTLEIEEKNFSKHLNNLIDKTVKKNLEYGSLFHECLEYLYFKNPNYTMIKDEFMKNKIKSFFTHLKDIDMANIYKEMEFMYQENNIYYHGVIDLMLEYDDHIDIIDYKLKSIDDENYYKQLNGYKNYVANISKKRVNIYLYSIIDEEFKKIDI